MDFEQAVEMLDARTNYERSGRLTSPTRARIEALLDLLAHPEKGYQSIHITGTNGKTTTAAAATEVLKASGLSVGTYTSPHLESIRERIRYDGDPISEDDFAEAWRELAPFLHLIDTKHDQPITWFEAATALAFLWFADKGIDVAVIEVGMGGEWDATNVIDGSVAAITRIGIDHAVLGDTVEAVAREKAGIIKPDAILFTAEQTQEAAAILRARCEEVGAEIRAEGIAFELDKVALALGGQVLSFRIERDRYTDVFLPMFGEHFARDAVLGAAAARAMLGGASLYPGLVAEAFSQLRVPGRMEIVGRKPLVVLDGAHNPEAARALANALPKSFTYERLHVIAGVMADKDARGILEPLVAMADDVVLTRADSPRAAEPEVLAEHARALGANVRIAQNVADAVSDAIGRAGESDAVLVTGSLYTVGEARSQLVVDETENARPRET